MWGRSGTEKRSPQVECSHVVIRRIQGSPAKRSTAPAIMPRRNDVSLKSHWTASLSPTTLSQHAARGTLLLEA